MSGRNKAMSLVRYETAQEYLDDDNITSSKQVAWSTLELEELSNGCSAYDMLDHIPEGDPREFFLMRRELELTREDAIKVFNLWLLGTKFPNE